MSRPSISIITPVYNGSKYLGEAARCVLGQTLADWEWLLVDDASTDGSDALAKEIAAAHPDKVRYLEHPGRANHGQFGTRVFAARNARADVVAFLDQDDAWDHDYLAKHLSLWESLQAQGIYLSYGPGHYWHPDDTSKDYVQPMPAGTPKVFAPGELLNSYFDAWYADTPCPCCTLIRREVLTQVEHLGPLAKRAAVEDQYLWWYVAARWPVSVHANAWAKYRQHADMSMVHFTRSPESFRLAERTFLQTVHGDLSTVSPGHPLLTSGKLAEKITSLIGAPTPAAAPASPPASTPPEPPAPPASRSLLKGLLSMSIFKELSDRVTGRGIRHRMAHGVEPLSENWGCERGEPLCRRYLLEFLREHTADVRGRCLEFQDNHYSGFLGGDKITKLDILNLEPEPKATIVADLTKPNDIPSDTFDCIICTHVLHVIPDLDTFLRELHRILKPGGVLLMAVPHVSMAGPEWHELWRFTDEGLHLVMGKAFGKENVAVKAYGNSLTAAGSLRGLVVSEFTEEELNAHDPRFAVEVCGRAVKQA